MGLLGALASRGNEPGKGFQLRAAAAAAIKALAVGLGPLLPAGWEAAAAALRTAKTDVSKPVREAATAALPVVVGLLDFLAEGAPAAAWPEACGALLAAAEAGRSRPAGTVHAAKAAGTSARLAHTHEPDCQQHIPALWAPSAAGGAVTSALPACSSAWLAAGAALPVDAFPLASLPACLSAPVAAAGPTVAFMPSAAGPEALSGGAFDCAQLQQLAAQLAAVQEQQAQMAAALSALTAAAHRALHQMQQHLAPLSAGVAALASGTAGGAGAEQHAALKQHLAAVNAGVAALATAAGGMHSTGKHSDMHASATGSPCRQHQRAAPEQAPPAQHPRRLSSLHRSYDALEQQRLGQATTQQQHQQRPWQHGKAAGSNAHSTAAGQPASGTLSASAADDGTRQTAHESVYSRLLSGSAAGADQPPLRLLRCMAKSGPVWEHLAPATGQRLMGAIVTLLQVACGRLPCSSGRIGGPRSSRLKVGGPGVLGAWHSCLRSWCQFTTDPTCTPPALRRAPP